MQQLKQDFIMKQFSSPMVLMQRVNWEASEIKTAYDNDEDFTYHMAELATLTNDFFKSIGEDPYKIQLMGETEWKCRTQN